MPETITQTVTPVQANDTQKPEAPKEDLITRASKVSLTAQPEKSGDTPQDAIKLDQATLDKISDPALKQAVIEAHKSMQADYTRKTQDLASRRKEMDTLKSQLESTGQYTPAKIQELLNNPSFVQAAQDYQRTINPSQVTAQNGNGELTQEEFSYLSPEQQKLYIKTKQMEQTLGTMNTRLQASEVERQDMGLKSKYANYDPQSVNDIYNGMMNGTIQATREHLWKVQDYDSAVKRAYQLGLEDRNGNLQEKVNASPLTTTAGLSVTSSNDVPVRLPHESGIEYFKRIAVHNAGKFMQKK